MVRLDKIYTRGGDGGQTSLGSGLRVAKHSERVEAFGCVDEANAILGCARLHCSGEDDATLARVQNDLFDLGADLCVPQDAKKGATALRIQPSHIKRLEDEIDRVNAGLAPLSSFILPGGSSAAAFLHLARTVVRRAERRVSTLAESEAIGTHTLSYLNRLSDHLFVMARALNTRSGDGDVLWLPGGNIDAGDKESSNPPKKTPKAPPQTPPKTPRTQ